MYPYSATFLGELNKQIRNKGHCQIMIERDDDLTYWVDEFYIESVKVRETGDPLSRSLPEEILEFVLIDYDGIWHPCKPRGLYTWFDNECQARLRFGIENDDGEIEYGPTTGYVFTGPPVWKDNRATFSATKVLGSLNTTFYQFPQGWYPRVSDLIDAIDNASGGPNIFAPEGLLPDIRLDIQHVISDITAKDALLQVASAFGFCLKTEFGLVSFVNLCKTCNLIDTNDLYELPGFECAPLIRNQIVTCYEHGDAPNGYDTTVSYEGNFSSTDQVTLMLKMPKVVYPDHYVTCSISNGEVTEFHNYRLAAEVTFTPTSTASPVKITISGKSVAVVSTTRTISINANGSEDEEFDNQLINSTNYESVAAYRAWYLSNTREAYTLEYRGNPSIQPYDLIRVLLPYKGWSVCVVLEAEFTFNGSFQGKLLVRRLSTVSEEQKISPAIAGWAIAGEAVVGKSM